MIRFMAVCFLFLGWAFWELSGGSDFEPTVKASVPNAVEQTPLEDDSEETTVTRNVVSPVDVAEENVTEPQVVLAAVEQTEVAEPAVVVEAAVTPEPTPSLELRQIAGNRVNMRAGPGTDFGVVARLNQGADVEVLQEPGNGWLKLRVVDSEAVGWIADWLVTASAG